jgi:hypothetical protein
LLGKTKVTRQKLALCGAVGLWLMTAACSMLPPTKDETVENNTCWYSSCLANLPRSQCKTDWYWAQIAQCIDMYIYILFIYLFIYIMSFLATEAVQSEYFQEFQGAHCRRLWAWSSALRLQNHKCQVFKTSPSTSRLYASNSTQILQHKPFTSQTFEIVCETSALIIKSCIKLTGGWHTCKQRNIILRPPPLP